MRKLLFPYIFLLFISCDTKERQTQQGTDKPINIADSLKVVNDPTVNLNIKMDTYKEIDSSAVLLFPLSVSENEDASGFSSSYKRMPENEYWNITFLNTKTNEYHLLSENKMLISNYKYNVEGYGKAKALDNKIFYTIKTTDFNKDKLINGKDPDYLFVTDKKGNNFKQISPANLHFVEWTYIDSSNKLILSLKKDTDKNNLFDEKDETVLFNVDANFEKEATEIFSVNFKNKLKVLFDRDWKRVKE